ncbi:MAG: hypothetical protein HY983_04100 [Candidatus Magasanikbacteria bacterium]|nr:hypothetical protein [Candidatus Magasanikbacteria bacterium]
MKQKQMLSLVVLAVLLANSSVLVSRVHASDEGERNNQTSSAIDNSTKNNSDGPGEGEDEADREDNQATQDEHDEGDLNQNFDTLANDVTSAAADLPEVSAKNLKTYGDVVAVLQSYQKELETLSAQADVSAALGGSLTDQEKALLQSLLKKHSVSFFQLNARIKEISDQMQVVINLLQPIAQSDVSPLLTKLLVGVANNFRDEIQSLKDLEHQNINVLDIETTI